MHSPIAEDVSRTVTRHTVTSIPFSFTTCVPRVLNVSNYIFPTHLQLSNGKWLSLRQETRLYVSGFCSGCCDHVHFVCNCDHRSLMERNPYTNGCPPPPHSFTSLNQNVCQLVLFSKGWEVFWALYSERFFLCEQRGVFKEAIGESTGGSSVEKGSQHSWAEGTNGRDWAWVGKLFCQTCCSRSRTEGEWAPYQVKSKQIWSSFNQIQPALASPFFTYLFATKSWRSSENMFYMITMSLIILCVRASSSVTSMMSKVEILHDFLFANAANLAGLWKSETNKLSLCLRN